MWRTIKLAYVLTAVVTCSYAPAGAQSRSTWTIEHGVPGKMHDGQAYGAFPSEDACKAMAKKILDANPQSIVASCNENNPDKSLSRSIQINRFRQELLPAGHPLLARQKKSWRDLLGFVSPAAAQGTAGVSQKEFMLFGTFDPPYEAAPNSVCYTIGSGFSSKTKTFLFQWGYRESQYTDWFIVWTPPQGGGGVWAKLTAHWYDAQGNPIGPYDLAYIIVPNSASGFPIVNGVELTDTWNMLVANRQPWYIGWKLCSTSAVVPIEMSRLTLYEKITLP